MTFMVRRPKVRRHADGVPFPQDRCQFEIRRDGRFWPDRCRRARLRGSAFCWQHQT